MGRVAIVHDYLNQRGGAEKVVLELSDMWPSAPIYTSLYRPDSTFAEFRGRDIRTSFLDRLPVDRGFRNLFPLYPAAFWSLGEIDADVVITSSSGWAHMARTVPGAVHVVYCHTPARWLYADEYMNSGGRRARRQAMLAPLAPALRRLDSSAARRADLYIANSLSVRERDPQRLRARARRRLSAGRHRAPAAQSARRAAAGDLAPAAVQARRPRRGGGPRLGRGLDVVGDGPLLDELRRAAGPTRPSTARRRDETVTALLESCSAVCVAGEEDFGIVAVEAQAAGKPVVAFGRGGALRDRRGRRDRRAVRRADRAGA